MEELDFLKDLNGPQRAAVEYTDGASLVIAGAGAGKTRVLTCKIAYLLKQKGMKPWNILALTFTNKAAREMKERIAQIVDVDCANALWMGTFHSMFNRILRQEVAHIGFTPNYTIYQPQDCKSLVNAILKEMELDNKVYKPGTVCGKISEAKNALILPAEYAEDARLYKRDARALMPHIGDIYKRYATRMHDANAMDFDDLLLNTFLLFERCPDICRKYASRFHYILVDEYQDTNYAQYEILRKLSDGNNHICVVGDDAQSIYSFRGARIDNILNFTGQYKGAKLFKLEQNYRSTQSIVAAANSVIAHNKKQIKKNIFSENASGRPLSLNVAYSDVEEGEIVCNRIQRLCNVEKMSYQNIAILYRTNAQSRIFEEGLRKRVIPYRIYGGRSFYDQKEIRDVLAYFRLIVNPDDEEALKRIINFPARGIGNTTLERLTRTAADNGVGIWSVVEAPENFQLTLGSAALKRIAAFRELVKGFMERCRKEDAYVLGQSVMKDCGIFQEACKNHDAEGKEVFDNLSELVNGIHTFVQMQQESGEEDHVFLEDYLSEISLLSSTDDQETEQQDKVTLMTVHSAKGLEFDAVFIVGMEENLFPNSMAMGNDREMEEERRLFYVAITRARTYCFLSCSKTRFHYGTTEYCEPSHFLNEIDKKYLSLEGNASRSVDKPKSQRNLWSRTVRPLVADERVAEEEPCLDTVVENGMTLRVGRRVLHEQFGEGEILSLEGKPGNIKAVVLFDNSGEKRLLLKYAKIKLI